MSSAGDVLLTSPLLGLIKEKEPDSEIHFVVKSQFADLIRLNPNVSRLHLVQDHADFHQLEHIRGELIGERFDLTLDLHNNFRSIYLRRGTAPAIRVVRKDVLRRAVLVNSKLNIYNGVKSVALKYARTYDKTVSGVSRPRLYFPDAVLERMDEKWSSLAAGARPAVFLCPGARHFTKRWPLEYWRELATKLLEPFTVVLLGGIEDVPACVEIQRGLDILNFAGQFSLIESSAMLRHAAAVVTNDSYLMHAANAVGIKTVAIFGSSVREFGFFPYEVEHKVMEVTGLPCRPCSHIGLEACPSKHFKCMKDTSPEAVRSSVLEILKS